MVVVLTQPTRAGGAGTGTAVVGPCQALLGSEGLLGTVTAASTVGKSSAVPRASPNGMAALQLCVTTEDEPGMKELGVQAQCQERSG